MTSVTIILTAAALILLAGPLILGLVRLADTHRARADTKSSSTIGWNPTLIVVSTLLYTLSFNLTFFIQELALVVSKAMVPGLRPTLFHNNHLWEGNNPLANLLQGTGALATFLVGIFCAILLHRRRGGAITVSLFFFWMAYSGIFMALPQVAIGALSPQNDVGMAMDYLGLGTAAKTIAALFALAAIPPFSLWLGSLLPGLGSSDMGSPDSSNNRTHFVFQVATLPSLLAIPLIVLFRVPREWIEVLLLPVLVTLIGISWIQAGAGSTVRAKSNAEPEARSIAWAVAAVLILLLVFQLVLRPGIQFG